MLSKRRKTLVVCVECHKKIRKFIVEPNKNTSSTNGEPDTPRGVSPVRREV